MGIKYTPNSTKPFERGLCNSNAEGISLDKAFSAFLEIVVIALVNANPREKGTERWNKREEKYFRLIELWKDKSIPVQMLADLIDLMEQHKEEKRDILGEMYERFISLGENGQFFTPPHIADFMAKAIHIDKDEGPKVCDVACGSGKLLMGALKNNPQTKLFGIDIDRRCVMMALLNCYFYGGCGEFVVGNGLLNNFTEGWKCGYGMMYELDFSKQTNPTEEKVDILEDKQASQQPLF